MQLFRGGRYPHCERLVFAQATDMRRVRIDPAKWPLNAQLWVDGACFELTPKAERRIRTWLAANDPATPRTARAQLRSAPR